MSNRILLILMWIILCPTIVQAQSATVVVWGNYVWIDGVSMSMDEYNFLYGGGAGGPYAEDDAVAIENSDLSGGGASHYGPWVYIGEYGKWTSIPGKIDVGSAWADNTITPGNITVTVSIVCKMSYKLTSEIGIDFDIIGLTVGNEVLSESNWTVQCVGEVPYGVVKTFTAEALKLGLSVQFIRREYTLGILTGTETAWGCAEKPDISNVGFRTS